MIREAELRWTTWYHVRRHETSIADLFTPRALDAIRPISGASDKGAEGNVIPATERAWPSCSQQLHQTRSSFYAVLLSPRQRSPFIPLECSMRALQILGLLYPYPQPKGGPLLDRHCHGRGTIPYTRGD